MASNLTTRRLLANYQERFHRKLYKRGQEIKADNFALAREIAAWKRRVSRSWDQVKVLSVDQPDMSRAAMKTGEGYHIEVDVDIDGLHPEDIGVEVIVADQITGGHVKIVNKLEFEIASVDGSVVKYVADPVIENTGTYDVAMRLFARNPKLPHRMDFALVKWV